MYIGIDVGGTNLRAGITDESGTLICVEQIPLEFRGAEALAETLASLSEEVVAAARCSLAEIRSVGIGIPGAVSRDKVLYTSNIPLRDVPLVELMEHRLKPPVLLENDANCAVVGEWLCGSGRGCENFAVVTIGTGIGGGFVWNGKLCSGGTVGEIGHMVIHGNGHPCVCGRRGCWEAHAAAPALIRGARQAMERHPESLLYDLSASRGTLDGETVFCAAEAGDPAALEVCRIYVEDLALGVTNLVNVVQPEVLALSGGIAGAPKELLLDPLCELVKETCYSRFIGVWPRIVRAELGNDAGVVGAALLGRVI